MIIERALSEKLHHLINKFPVVTLTGTRQCGKSTLLKSCLPDYKYISLENIDLRQMAINDPRGFLDNFGDHIVIDEAQYAPELFSYIQVKVDEKNDSGMYILSGSHNFLLMEKVSQSLAGRTAVLKLAPFSARELKSADLLPKSLNEWLFKGGFPRIYDKDIDPVDYFPSYIQTYIERDVRQLRNIPDLSAFIRFLKLCAARIGQVLNVSSLANACDISVPTVQAWLSILETSYVIFLLKPYHKNYNKRLVKSPKLYFFDTGLAASLLGLEKVEQIETFYLRGEMFENMIIAEKVKEIYSQGKEPQIYFWQDSNRNEVDLLVEQGLSLQAIEIKSGATLNSSFFDGLRKFQALTGLPNDSLSVVYGGDFDYRSENGNFISWRNL